MESNESMTYNKNNGSTRGNYNKDKSSTGENYNGHNEVELLDKEESLIEISNKDSGYKIRNLDLDKEVISSNVLDNK